VTGWRGCGCSTGDGAPVPRRLGRRVLLATPALLLGRGALALELAGGLMQGGFVTGRAAPGTRLTLDGRAVRVAASGAFAFGFGRDAGATATLAILHPGGRREEQRLAITPREWEVQHIQGLPPAQVTPDAAALARITAERERLAAVRAVDTARTDFGNGFGWPAQGRISGVFGSQRVLNGQPRQPHYGLDIAAPVGTPIFAPATGQVTLAGDFFFFGRLLVLDHGHGVNTLDAHCSALEVAEGEAVTAGQRIGGIGATGRVTGAHLHFSLSWFTTWLDPRPALSPAG